MVEYNNNRSIIETKKNLFHRHSCCRLSSKQRLKFRTTTTSTTTTTTTTTTISLLGSSKNNNEMEQQRQQQNRKKWIVSSLLPPEVEEEGEDSSLSENSSNNNNNNNNRKKDTAATTTSSTTTLAAEIKSSNTRLILHFDINETILLGDPAGDDTRDDSVQKMIAKSAFCQIPNKSCFCINNNNNNEDESEDDSWKLFDQTNQMEPTHWWDGQEIGNEKSIPPLYTGWEWPKYCIPYYRTKYKSRSKQFCHNDGKIYQPILEQCEVELQNGHILPAFYKTMEYLIQQSNKPFTLVFRTFGDDIDQISQLITEFAQGKHPNYPHIQYPDLELPQENIYQGRWKQIQQQEQQNQQGEDCIDGSCCCCIYQLWNKEETKLIASGDEEILTLLENHTCCGIRDDYKFWSSNNWYPTAGKPVWVPSKNKVSGEDDNDIMLYDHHLFFDDNIHNLPNDGIACVRKQLDGDDDNKQHQFITLDGKTMHTESIQGIHLIRVPTVEPVLNPNWYIEQIQKAQSRLALLLSKK